MTSRTPRPFFSDGLCEDLAYQNIRDDPTDSQCIENLWARYQGLEDPNFLSNARNHFHQRFWEMYFAVTLMERGFTLRREGNTGPEFYTLINGNRIWFEAVAPGPGEGSDRAPEIVFGECTKVPTDKIILRLTNAFDVKKAKYNDAVKKGTVRQEDSYILAINSFGIQHTSTDVSTPYAAQAFLGEADPAYVLDGMTGEVVDSCSQYRPEIAKLSGETVSTKVFHTEEASFCSAIICSDVCFSNRGDTLGLDFYILHNHRASHPIGMNLFAWCTQWSYVNGKLVKCAI